MRLLVVIILGLGLGSHVSAGTIYLSAAAQGWMTPTLNNGSFASNSYLAGNCGAGDCYTGEFRNFFEFGIPALDGPVLSATLLLDTRSEVLRQSASIAYQVTSLSPGFGFDDLGTGAIYGSRTYTTADQYQQEGIALDAAAIADLQRAAGGSFTLGGRVTSSVAFGAGQPDQLVFGRTDAPQQLVIVTGSALAMAPVQLTNASVPEPSSAVFLAVGLVLVFAGRLRRM